ncbi:MAG: hypothetical protein NC541_13165 [bacterium]|nr:hypothetical protein [bacterium]
MGGSREIPFRVQGEGFKQAAPQLELRVQLWNINAGKNECLKEQCQVLKEYMQYEECVREKAKTVPVKEAVPLAVDECIKAGILSDFLRKNKAEVIPMSIYEYDEAAVMEVIREEGREEGWEAGREEGIGLMKQLMKRLQESGRQEEIWKITADDTYMRKMLSEYGIK